jgi:hypothetical protein
MGCPSKWVPKATVSHLLYKFNILSSEILGFKLERKVDIFTCHGSVTNNNGFRIG